MRGVQVESGTTIEPRDKQIAALQEEIRRLKEGMGGVVNWIQKVGVDNAIRGSVIIEMIGSLKQTVIMTPEKKKERQTQCWLQKLKQDKKQKGVVIRENELIAYFKRELKGQTEFRVVVYEDGSGYAHVLGRDSETINFDSIWDTLKRKRDWA